MRSVSCGILLVAISLAVSSGSQIEAQVRTDTEAKLQEITIDDLQGSVINGTIAYAGQGRWSGDNIVRPLQQVWQFRAQIGPEAAIKWTVR